MKQIIKIWIDIAKSDLSSSKILYKNEKYRNSYFLFQQASEKANKAYALLNKTLSEKELSKVQHDQTKIYRKSVIEQQKSIVETVELIDNFKIPSFPKTYDEIIANYNTSLKKSISYIDSLRNCDLVNISYKELDENLNLLKELRNFKIILPENFKDLMKSKITELINWISQFNTENAKQTETEFRNLLNNNKESEEFFNIMTDKILPLMYEVTYVSYTLFTCAILTIQHSSLTRYPSDGIDPENIYVKELPIINKQMEFIFLLEECLTKIEKWNT
ncbi:HEPN domain-containing protein [Tenacibaculum finnmarkense]|uniref:HEPN domain-containing protein n=1 Tax=Tenacibaculum finnmarkense TaxID=2781243 RepID=UPI001EFA3A13|nr:HEPN domain-containing protein [Tenacibaculum finnmarkense]MCG8860082.1 HEPN domain-containing protein [Tenacibaculum finnmarkense]